ncbi:arginine--tRNA ligase [Clavibacter michiganensis]|nr:arginine--tRNA ligase [Clavibacter michiganensis]
MHSEGGESSTVQLQVTDVLQHLLAVPPSDLVRTAFTDEQPPVLVEHTSINPVHPVHLAALRGSLVGNAIVTARRALGAEVTTAYFVNDLGKQVRILVDAIRRGAHLDRRPDRVRFDRAVGVVYAAANMIEAKRWSDLGTLSARFPWLADVLDVERLTRVPGDVETVADDDIRQDVVDRMTSAAAHDLSGLGITIDRWEHESALELPPVQRLAALTHARTVRINGTICASLPAGRIPLLRRDGVPFYFAKDVENLRARPWTHMVHVVGNEQAFLQRELAQVAARESKHLKVFGVGIVTVSGRSSSARQHRMICVEDVEEDTGRDGLEALALGMLAVPRSAPLRLPLQRQPWVVKTQHRLRRMRTGLPSGSPSGDEAAVVELLTLLLRAPGIIKGVADRGNVHAIVFLLRSVLEADERAGSARPDHIVAHTSALVELLAKAAGIPPLDEIRRKEVP